MIGKTIKHYEILERLGGGGMGVVYLARDIKLNRRIALKFLPQDLSRDAEANARFVQEAQAASGIEHENICTIHEIGETDDGQMFIAMPAYQGQTLKKRLEDGSLSLGEALDVALQIARGLEAAHRKGIIHRDIKPANVMLTGHGRVVILDFGLAKLSGSLGLTRTGSTIGTAAYMSPEQIKAEPVDERSDIWSLGVVLYEMIMGRRPFEGDYEQALTYAVLNSEPEIPPGEIGQVINRALSKNVAERFDSVSDFLEALEQVRGSAGERITASDKNRRQKISLRSFRGVSAFVGTLIVLIALVTVIRWLTATSELQIEIGAARAISAEDILELDPAISPDGRFIAYAAGPIAGMDVFMRQIAGGRAINVTEDFVGHHRWPRWSPDGARIAFITVSNDTSSINIVPALGGVAEGVTEPALGSVDFSPAAHGQAEGSPAWAPDGQRVAYAQGNSIYVYDLGDGSTTHIADSFLPHSLSWSPDGGLIAFVAGNDEFVFGTVTFGNIAPSSIQVVSSGGGEPIAVTPNDALNVSPSWLPDGRNLVYVSDRAGTRDIYQILLKDDGRPVGDSRRLTTGLGAHTVDVAEDGSNLAYSLFWYRANVWSIRVPEKGSISISEAEPVTAGNQVIEAMAVSPDGKWLAFDSDRTGNADLFKMEVSGGQPRQLTTHPAGDFLPSWSPDGEEIVFHSFRNGNRDVFVVTADGRSIQNVDDHPAQDRFQDWSPDGNRIVFHSDRAGPQQLFVATRNYETGEWEEPEQLTKDGGNHPRWSPDGRYIAYISILGNSLMLITPDGQEVRRLYHSEDAAVRPVPVFPEWSPDGQTVYYHAFAAENNSSFWAIPVEGGEPELLVAFDVPSRPASREVFVTDGKTFYFTLPSRQSDIWLMDLKLE